MAPWLLDGLRSSAALKSAERNDHGLPSVVGSLLLACLNPVCVMGGSVPAIPGNKATGGLLNLLRQEVATVLERNNHGFPGAQPVSFAARHMLELQKQDYYVCEKSDGIRCMMYLTADGPNQVVYLIDRKNDYYHVPNLLFPLGTDPREFHTATILDGELVNDTDSLGVIQMKYLVFDCLVLDGNLLLQRTLDKRIGYFIEKVYLPYDNFYKIWQEEVQYLPFMVEKKKMEFSYGIEMMFRVILPELKHGNDGLIFTCRNTPYQFGTDQHILKWKTEDENSIDFRMALGFPIVDPDSDDEDRSPYPDYTAMPQFRLAAFSGDNKEDIVFGTMYVEANDWESMKALEEPLNDRIVECYLDKQNRWRFLRFRDDKKEANHISTVESVMESIQDKVSKDDLIRVSKKIRDEWKKRQAAAADADAEVRKAMVEKPAANGQYGEISNGHPG